MSLIDEQHGQGSAGPRAQPNDAGRWTLRLLGECDLRAPNGAPIVLSTRKSLALLAYLARQPGRRALRERLASLLWEDAAPAQARLNLRKTLSSLRKETRAPAKSAADLIVSNGDAVWLAPGALVSDVDALEAAMAALAGDPDRAAEAAGLFAGDFLSDFSLRGAQAFEAWAQIERQRVREIAIAAMMVLMERALQPGASPETGVIAAMRLLALDPLQEGAHRALMRLYVRQGRHAAALKQFHAMSELLARELGTGPEPESCNLFREISHARHTRQSQVTSYRPSPGRIAPEQAGSAPPSASETPRVMSVAMAALIGLAAAAGGWAYFSRSSAAVARSRVAPSR